MPPGSLVVTGIQADLEHVARIKGAPKNNFQDYPTGSQTQVVARRGLSV